MPNLFLPVLYIQYTAKTRFAIISNKNILLSNSFTHSPPINPSGQTEEIIIIEIMITAELIKINCFKVSFDSLLDIVAIFWL